MKPLELSLFQARAVRLALFLGLAGWTIGLHRDKQAWDAAAARPPACVIATIYNRDGSIAVLHREGCEHDHHQETAP